MKHEAHARIIYEEKERMIIQSKIINVRGIYFEKKEREGFLFMQILHIKTVRSRIVFLSHTRMFCFYIYKSKNIHYIW